MSTLLMRQDPFAVEFVSFDLEREPMPEDRALPLKVPGPIGVVVTGDNHLSPTLPRLSPQRRAERRDRLRVAFAAAVTHAIEHGARLFVHVGDLFDTPSPSNQDRAFVAQALNRLRRAGVTCVAISGNHDTPRLRTEHGGAAPHEVYAALDAWHYFAENDVLRPRLFVIGGLRVAIAGLSNNPTSPPGSDPLAGIAVDDEDGVLERADIGLLLLHAGIEGLCQPNEGERIIARRSIEALPAAFRAVVAGHIHRYGRQRLGEREIVVSGSTERMEFGGAANTSGFAWLDLAREGVVRAEHVRVEEQPRVDLRINTARLWRGADVLQAPDADVASVADVANAADMADMMGNPPALLADALPEPDAMPPADVGIPTPDPLATLRAMLAQVCTPETMVRLRLSGPLTREQYHTLALRDLLIYGQQHAFSFDLDTSGLTLAEPEQSATPVAQSGPVAPTTEVERLAAEHVESLAADGEMTADDVWAAARLLLTRLQSDDDHEAAR